MVLRTLSCFVEPALGTGSSTLGSLLPGDQQLESHTFQVHQDRLSEGFGQVELRGEFLVPSTTRDGPPGHQHAVRDVWSICFHAAGRASCILKYIF